MIYSKFKISNVYTIRLKNSEFRKSEFVTKTQFFNLFFAMLCYGNQINWWKQRVSSSKNVDLQVGILQNLRIYCIKYAWIKKLFFVVKFLNPLYFFHLVYSFLFYISLRLPSNSITWLLGKLNYLKKILSRLYLRSNSVSDPLCVSTPRTTKSSVSTPRSTKSRIQESERKLLDRRLETFYSI